MISSIRRAFQRHIILNFFNKSIKNSPYLPSLSSRHPLNSPPANHQICQYFVKKWVKYYENHQHLKPITAPIRTSVSKIQSEVDVLDMDKVLPPPNGCLEEIQAWNNMMDSIVAFFKACSHLMSIITNKMNGESRGVSPKWGRHLNEITRSFEPEWRPCRPRSLCATCGRKRALSRGISGIPSAAEKSALQDGGGDKCICAEIKAMGFEEKKDRCRSSRNKPQEREKEERPPVKHSEMVEMICGRDTTPGDRASTVMKKVDTAQQEISRLQGKQVKMQSMDASRKITPHGGPNPEALYREIMKDNTGVAASQRPVGPPRRHPYPTRIPEGLHPSVLDPSTGRSSMRFPGMLLAGSRVARRYCPAHIYNPYSPSSVETSSPTAVEFDGIDLSSQSSMESSRTPNIFPPEACPCGVTAQGFGSQQSFTSSSQPSIEASLQEYKETSPTALPSTETQMQRTKWGAPFIKMLPLGG